MVRVHVFNPRGELVGPVESPQLSLSDAEWQKRLTPDQYEVSRGKGTQRPFCGTLLDNKQQGVYTCIGCGLPLFSSADKFNSGTGWPSFFQPIGKGNVAEIVDSSHGMRRTEILCAVRRPPRARLRRWTPPDRTAILLEFGVAGVHAARRRGEAR